MQKSPSAALIDSQSVKATEGGERGHDVFKNVTGRKRHLGVDTLGLLLAVVVTAARVQDRDGGKLVLKRIDLRYPRLKADLGRRGVPGARRLGMVDPLGRAGDRAADVPGVEVQPKRWIVERTSAWLGRYRRLGKDDERQAETSEAVIQWR